MRRKKPKQTPCVSIVQHLERRQLFAAGPACPLAPAPAAMLVSVQQEDAPGSSSASLQVNQNAGIIQTYSGPLQLVENLPASSGESSCVLTLSGGSLNLTAGFQSGSGVLNLTPDGTGSLDTTSSSLSGGGIISVNSGASGTFFTGGSDYAFTGGSGTLIVNGTNQSTGGVFAILEPVEYRAIVIASGGVLQLAQGISLTQSGLFSGSIVFAREAAVIPVVIGAYLTPPPTGAPVNDTLTPIVIDSTDGNIAGTTDAALPATSPL